MELALAIFNVGAGLGLLAVGVALLYLAWRLTPLVQEARVLARDVRELAHVARDRLPALAERGEDILRGADLVTGDAALQVSRLRDAVDALEAHSGSAPLSAAAHPSGVASVESGETPDGWSNR
jgi:hypothetical protein